MTSTDVFPTGYDVAVIDCPWNHYGSPDKMAAAGKHYSLLTDEALLALPVKSAVRKPGVVFVWATCPRLDFAIDCIREWGLHYRGVAFVWVKTSKKGLPIGAQGVRPSIVKPLVELVLAASTERLGRPLKLSSESVVQTIFDEDGVGLAEPIFAPRGAHSEKPQAAYDRIHALYPQHRKVDIFSRQERPGFTAWGDQVGLLTAKS